MQHTHALGCVKPLPPRCPVALPTQTLWPGNLFLPCGIGLARNVREERIALEDAVVCMQGSDELGRPAVRRIAIESTCVK